MNRPALALSVPATAAALISLIACATAPTAAGGAAPGMRGIDGALERSPVASPEAGVPAAPVPVPEPERPTEAVPELEVPFSCGSRVTVSQSHGTFSHVGTDRWAWDFRVPEGTPVVAALDGVVRMVRSDSVRGGCDRSFGPDANYVIIEHGNGLETQYLHFSKVFVELGQEVKAGTVIGEVGRTGFSCGAHLHFQLQKTREGHWANQSVPARFRGIGDPQAEEEIVSANCGGEPAGEPLQAGVSGERDPQI